MIAGVPKGATLIFLKWLPLPHFLRIAAASSRVVGYEIHTVHRIHTQNTYVLLYFRGKKFNWNDEAFRAIDIVMHDTHSFCHLHKSLWKRNKNGNVSKVMIVYGKKCFI